jgi:predicted transcriptional regulator
MDSNTNSISGLSPLGDLEIAVLEFVWRTREASVKQVHAELGVARGLALNTIQSTLDRLFRKQLLDREKISYAFHYSARLPREKLLAGLIKEVLQRFENDSASSLAAFVEVAEQLDEEALQALENKLKALREGRGG